MSHRDAVRTRRGPLRRVELVEEQGGHAVTLTLSGLPTDATGTVKFTSGKTTPCTATVSNGEASCKTSKTLPAGTRPRCVR